MDDLKRGLGVILFFWRDYSNLPNDVRRDVFKMYITLASMAAQVAVDMTLSIGHDMRLAGACLGFVTGALCYLTLSYIVYRKASIFVGVDRSHVLFTTVFTAAGVIGSLAV